MPLIHELGGIKSAIWFSCICCTGSYVMTQQVDSVQLRSIGWIVAMRTAFMATAVICCTVNGSDEWICMTRLRSGTGEAEMDHEVMMEGLGASALHVGCGARREARGRREGAEGAVALDVGDRVAGADEEGVGVLGRQIRGLVAPRKRADELEDWRRGPGRAGRAGQAAQGVQLDVRQLQSLEGAHAEDLDGALHVVRGDASLHKERSDVRDVEQRCDHGFVRDGQRVQPRSRYAHVKVDVDNRGRLGRARLALGGEHLQLPRDRDGAIAGQVGARVRQRVSAGLVQQRRKIAGGHDNKAGNIAEILRHGVVPGVLVLAADADRDRVAAGQPDRGRQRRDDGDVARHVADVAGGIDGDVLDDVDRLQRGKGRDDREVAGEGQGRWLQRRCRACGGRRDARDQYLNRARQISVEEIRRSGTKVVVCAAALDRHGRRTDDRHDRGNRVDDHHRAGQRHGLVAGKVRHRVCQGEVGACRRPVVDAAKHNNARCQVQIQAIPRRGTGVNPGVRGLQGHKRGPVERQHGALCVDQEHGAQLRDGPVARVVLDVV
eukprot:m.18476 g.18476  ORF g.18476 m.18476 type:complete len:549 (+) comp3345_c0_seq1:1937-3583(+)